MELENRYIVIKRKDAEKYLTSEELLNLSSLCILVEKGREHDNKPPMKSLVIESDWPEFIPTFNLLETRVDQLSIRGQNLRALRQMVEPEIYDEIVKNFLIEFKKPNKTVWIDTKILQPWETLYHGFDWNATGSYQKWSKICDQLGCPQEL